MHVALNERLAGLPDDTKTYVGHEYTKSNGPSCYPSRVPLADDMTVQSHSPNLWIPRTRPS